MALVPSAGSFPDPAMKILVTGGGTGGHVAPAIAVIQELRKIAPDVAIRYVGSEAGVEAKLAAENGVEFVGVATGKLRRTRLLSTANVKDAFRIPVGVAQAMKAVRAFKPDAVLATGGYVCVPTVIAAALQKVPILTHEQTVTIGLANRIAGRFATKIALTFENSLKEMPEALKKKAFVTGNPLRDAIFRGDRQSGAKRFGFDENDNDLPCVYVTGGAQGSRIINNAIKDALPELLQIARVLHQSGKSDIEALTEHHRSLSEVQRSRWRVQAFVESDQIGNAYALCDVLVGRAGAGTVTEACALGKPAIYIPLEPASGDEQNKNARRSADAGGAVVVKQAECRAETILAALKPLLTDEASRKAMGEAARKLATPNAAGALAETVLALAGRR
jgi:UDP-N-acetylglucosamine--N-acetylmuramyl-(pentapeptide) pyrophosphoryl-undecaprenol N-acetylglucosamine transferase